MTDPIYPRGSLAFAKVGLKRGPHDGGFTYLALLVSIAIVGIWLLALSEVWSSTLRNRQLAQLEWVGQQFTQAIGGYYQASPGLNKRYPASLQDLLEDRRGLVIRRYLREVYLNPLSGKRDWELVLSADGRVIGVRVTASDVTPIARCEFIYRPM